MSNSIDAKSPPEYLHTVCETKKDGEHAQHPFEYLCIPQIDLFVPVLCSIIFVHGLKSASKTNFAEATWDT